MKVDNTDRYVSYKGIDCAGNSKQLMIFLCQHIDNPERSNPFWEKFKGLLAQAGKPSEKGERCIDELFLIHTYVNNLYEIFEEYDDNEALALLERIERECC
jgi:hypothetical protein